MVIYVSFIESWQIGAFGFESLRSLNYIFLFYNNLHAQRGCMQPLHNACITKERFKVKKSVLIVYE